MSGWCGHCGPYSSEDRSGAGVAAVETSGVDADTSASQLAFSEGLWLACVRGEDLWLSEAVNGGQFMAALVQFCEDFMV